LTVPFRVALVGPMALAAPVTTICTGRNNTHEELALLSASEPGPVSTDGHVRTIRAGPN
jgi:hypothetical protein